MKPKPLRPKLDASQLAKYIVDVATGEIEETYPPAKNPAAVALGKLGGAKGGKTEPLTATDSVFLGFGLICCIGST